MTTTIKRALAGLAFTATIALAVPSAPALANGAASTRNIFFGAAAATYLVIQHNRKVHEKYAEDARRQAALQSENSDAWAAYHQEQRAYAEELAVNTQLKREIAYQHSVVEQQRHMLAARGRSVSLNGPRGRVAKSTRRVAQHAANSQVAVVSYGWGQL